MSKTEKPKRRLVPARESFAAWAKKPNYRKAYDALAEEFGLAAEIIGARTHANLTQEELAERMKTTQSVIARLESGRTRPSTRTLEKLAAATGTQLRISLVPQKRRA